MRRKPRREISDDQLDRMREELDEGELGEAAFRERFGWSKCNARRAIDQRGQADDCPNGQDDTDNQ